MPPDSVLLDQAKACEQSGALETADWTSVMTHVTTTLATMTARQNLLSKPVRTESL